MTLLFDHYLTHIPAYARSGKGAEPVVLQEMRRKQDERGVLTLFRLVLQ